MWKYAIVFLVIFPGAILASAVYFYKKYKVYPTGAVTSARAKKKEWERVREARRELRRIENGGGR
jgi:hypothetical protein